jgi:hypothetical protein
MSIFDSLEDLDEGLLNAGEDIIESIQDAADDFWD